MNLLYKSDDRIKHEELKDVCDENKIKYNDVDNDSHILKFKTTKEGSQDFQHRLADLMCGRCSGTFYTED